MTFSKVTNSKSSSKDAMKFAPCFCSAENYIKICADVVFSMSVFLCLLALIICPAIISIIILSIIIIKNLRKKQIARCLG